VVCIRSNTYHPLDTFSCVIDCFSLLIVLLDHGISSCDKVTTAGTATVIDCRRTEKRNKIRGGKI